MKTLLFVIIIIAVIVGMFFYLNRNDSIASNPEQSEYCKEFQDKINNDEDYIINYSERIKSVLHGCF